MFFSSPITFFEVNCLGFVVDKKLGVNFSYWKIRLEFGYNKYQKSLVLDLGLLPMENGPVATHISLGVGLGGIELNELSSGGIFRTGNRISPLLNLLIGTVSALSPQYQEY